jgi:pimeloyl-ACP methyl ester carboxylesterase
MAQPSEVAHAAAEGTQPVEEQLQIRVHPGPEDRTLIYIPGLHGDWTLVTSFRERVRGKVRFVEFTYPRTLVWSVENYARQVERQLRENGITQGWVLAESYGSQIGWAMLKPQEGFRAEGLILAGGFVHYPMKWVIRGFAWLARRMPLAGIRGFLSIYKAYARLRHRHAPETLGALDEFVERRNELDRQAIVHRLHCINAYDPRAIAAKAGVPVYHLAGLVDPIVPAWPVRAWLNRHCPSFRGGRVILRADHNVLGTAPDEAAEQIQRWMREA